MRLRRGPIGTLAVCALVGAFAAPAPASAAPVGVGARGGPAAPRVTTITLVTGDRVRVFAGSDAVGIEPAPGRERVGFVRDTSGGHLRIIPADAVPLLSAGRLDPRLFDLTELARQGFTDARAGTLPLIVSAPRSGLRGMSGTVGVARALPSIAGVAVREDKRRGSALWRWIAGGSAGHVWLDGIAHPMLDVSVPQIGAPTAWQLGLTGAGVTVGVLDTGIDVDHPDLAGKVVAARDFTGTRPDAGDDIGHGTHVAGIIAGTGAASGGRYRGVAPDAKLISGKVCVSFGCPDSDVIAGMEWIAPQAKVVNLSLGGDATDGSDPLAQAVDSLTARYGTLFVAAAGNDRAVDFPDPTEAVTSPATADAALAVGSVDAQDQPSPFSPPGPRIGDLALKPDIAAPGGGIVSARAAGTPDGDLDPVDANYARLSGTSMAAPHVAGAAALLLQQHPDWAADRLKPVLMGSALPTASVFAEGAGRVDVARAVTQQVSATGGSLSYGFFPWPHTQRVAKAVSYHNDGDAPVDLALSVDDPVFSLSTSDITVPAHGTASVTVTAVPALGAPGQHGVRLTATAPGIAVQTALAAVLEPESYDLTVRVRSRAAQSAGILATAVNAETGQAYGIRPFDGSGVARIRLPHGRYDVNAIDTTADQQVTLLSRPGVAVTADASVALDARAALPVRTVVDDPAVSLQFGELGVVSGDPGGTRTSALSWFARPGQRLFALPGSASVTDHTYGFFYRATLAAADPADDPATTLYQLAFLRPGRVPVPTFVVHDRDLARVDARYFGQGVAAQGLRADFGRLAFAGAASGASAGGIFEVYPRPLPSSRTEFYTASPDVVWQQLIGVFPADESDAEINWSIQSFAPGRYTANWARAPLGPAFGDPPDGWGVTVVGGQLSMLVSLLGGDDPRQFVSPPAGETGSTTLSRDGVELGTSPLPGAGAFPVADTSGTYVLHTTAQRAVPWSTVGTAADVRWTFHIGQSGTPTLLVVRASGAVDDLGQAPGGVVYPLRLLLQRQPGSAASPLTALRAEVSFDDGTTWRAVPTVRSRDGGLALVRHPAGPGFVSLRLSATDAAGDAVTQTVIRAYQLR